MSRKPCEEYADGHICYYCGDGAILPPICWHCGKQFKCSTCGVDDE